MTTVETYTKTEGRYNNEPPILVLVQQITEVEFHSTVHPIETLVSIYLVCL